MLDRIIYKGCIGEFGELGEIFLSQALPHKVQLSTAALAHSSENSEMEAHHKIQQILHYINPSKIACSHKV